MTENQPDPIFSQPVAPPTQPAIAVQPDLPSTWPKAIGIIAIVLGSLGVLQGGFGLIAPFFVGFLRDFLQKVLPKGQPTGLETLDVLKDWQGWLVFSSFLTMGIAALLLFAGIGVLKRRPSAVRLAFYWAIVKILFVIVQSVVSIPIQKEQFESMGQMPNMPQLGSGLVNAMVGGTVVIGIAWGWALPVFLLIWFSRKKIKAEVAGWR